MAEEKVLLDEKKRIAARRLAEAKMRVLVQAPFYGNLLLHLKVVLANCGTAATNMKKLIFDPSFVEELSDEELDFVLKHEVMHCALQHCMRGKEKNQMIYNIACDIVVNSNIMQSMHVSSFSVAGEEAMHLTPNKKEGYLFTADEVYDQLMGQHMPNGRDLGELLEELAKEYGGGFDDHDIWNVISDDGMMKEEWKQHLIMAIGSGMGSTPPGPLQLIKDLEYEAQVDWKTVLADFVKMVSDKQDYLFLPPDRRFTDRDYFLPALTEIYDEEIEDLWFVVDTSGSISTEELTVAFEEIKSAMGQFTHLAGKLSFFNTATTDPIPFEDITSLEEIQPVGGGGTSFDCIFEYMIENMKERFPVAIIILTDGYARYPDEEVACDVPVLWGLVDNSVDAPWGTSVHISSEHLK